MKNNKSSRKLYMSALAMAMATSAVVAVAPVTADAAKVSFSDVTSKTPHASAILNLAERGIVTGFPGGEFRPKEELTRAQAAKMLALSLDLDLTNLPDPGFTDVKSDRWYYTYIAALKNEGIINGFSKDLFKPDEKLKRSEIAKFLVLGYDLKGSNAKENPFVDVKADRWYEPFVSALYATGITTGKTAISYAPEKHVARGEFSTFIVRSENYVAKSTDLIADAKAAIRAVVELNEDYKVGDKLVAEADFDQAANALTIKSYDMDGLDQLSSSGFFSEQLPALGVYEIKIGDNDPVDVTQNFAAAKETIKTQVLAQLNPSADVAADGDVSAKKVKVTLFAEKDDTKFWEDFDLNLHVFLP